MKPIDLSGLIKGLMVVIGIAMAMGKLDELKEWAIYEAFPPTRALGQRRNKEKTHPKLRQSGYNGVTPEQHSRTN